MKKVFYFALGLLLPCFSALADDALNRVHPNEADYKIEGDFGYRLVDNQIQYELTNVVATGMQIQQKDVYIGNQQDLKEVMFSFDHITTSTGFPGFNNISYWYYDPDIKDWQPDVEIRKGEMTSVLNRDITLFLIIDCSSSLQNDFTIVKNASYSFLEQLYNAAPYGNVHVGIVGFSSMPDTRILPLQPLTANSIKNIRSFISSLSANNGTALFYAWDEAIKRTDAYIRSGVMSNYEKSHFITFTDGIDQTSQDINKRPTPIVNADDYYNYIIQNSKNTIKNYESDVVFVKGIDITNEQQQAKFENKLKNLAVPSDRLNYERLGSISKLEDKFSSIATRLTDSWQTLNCYVAPARHGRVCWTFGKAEKPEPVKVVKAPRTGRNIFLGLNGTVGVGVAAIGTAVYNPNGRLGVDFAWPVADKFAIGAYISMGGGATFIPEGGNTDGYWGVRTGILMLAGNINKKPFVIGISPFSSFGRSNYNVRIVSESGTAYYEYWPLIYSYFELRFGRVIGPHFYITGNIAAGRVEAPFEDRNMAAGGRVLTPFEDRPGVIFEPSISLGYHFGDKLKTKGKRK